MMIENHANDVAQNLVGLTKYEKKLACNRLNKFYDGKMPLWNQQFLKSGEISCGYLLVAYIWGAWAGSFLILATTVAVIPSRSGFLIVTEILFYAVSILLFVAGLVRWRWAIQMGRHYRGN